MPTARDARDAEAPRSAVPPVIQSPRQRANYFHVEMLRPTWADSAWQQRASNNAYRFYRGAGGVSGSREICDWLRTRPA